MIFKYLHKLCIDENLSYVIAGDTGVNKSYELDYYESFIGSKKINIIRNISKSYSSYLLGLKSNVIIGHRSTMLREFIGFKKKVISVNGLLEKIGSLNIFTYKKNLNSVEWKAKDKSYENFSVHLLKVLRMSTRKYFDIFKNYNYFMHHDNNIIDIVRKKNLCVFKINNIIKILKLYILILHQLDSIKNKFFKNYKNKKICRKEVAGI